MLVLQHTRETVQLHTPSFLMYSCHADICEQGSKKCFWGEGGKESRGKGELYAIE